MTFQESIRVCFSKYADFNGRADRSNIGGLSSLSLSLAWQHRWLAPSSAASFLLARYYLQLPLRHDVCMIQIVAVGGN